MLDIVGESDLTYPLSLGGGVYLENIARTEQGMIVRTWYGTKELREKIKYFLEGEH